MLIGILLLLPFVGIASYFRLQGYLIALSGIIGVALGDVIESFYYDEMVLTWWAYLLVAIIGILCCVVEVRRFISNKIFVKFKKVTPVISDTEQTAIDTGTVWWDGELFSGKPDFNKLIDLPDPKFTQEEQSFFDGSVEEICREIDDWKIVYELKDLPTSVWQKMKDSGIFGMIIKKKYGGLEFSNYAHAKIVMKIASRGVTAGVTVMVPNSLGPGELLQHYGTEEQKNYYLPRLAKGLEIPCFALTSPFAGSDAGNIPDYGIVSQGDFTDPITGETKKNILGITIFWEKRWITLAPVATLLGLAFKMFDPNSLLGDKKDIGITCALVPTSLKGVNIGRRHFPSGSVFQNGPTWGADVFIPLDYIIGGVEQAGQGWKMLIECLTVGRCISLPATSVGGGKIAAYTTSLYSVIRDQFKISIGKFEGVNEAIARICANVYQMEASQDLALAALDTGHVPSVISAILKYNNTEKLRKTILDALDVHAGKAVVAGPRNYLLSFFQAVPVAITVEGANILTRCLMIFGQGAIRCHPYALKEMQSAFNDDGKSFDKLFASHLHFVLCNGFRSFWLSLTNAIFVSAPSKNATAKYYKYLTRATSNFALLVDGTMATVGGSLKFKEKLSGKLADVVSNLYIASAVLKKFQRDGYLDDDIELMNFSAQLALYEAENAMYLLLQNLPNRFVAFLLKILVFPLGRRFKYPSDQLGTKVANIMMENQEALKRLTKGIYISDDVNDPIGVLKYAYEAINEAYPIEKKINELIYNNKLEAVYPKAQLQEAFDKNIITKKEFDLVTKARKLKRDVIMVDDFDANLDKYDKNLLDRFIF